MGYDLLVVLSVAVYIAASYFDAKSSLRLAGYGISEGVFFYWQFWSKKKRRLFSLPSYIVITGAAIFITMKWSYGGYKADTVTVFFGMAGIRFAAAFLLNPWRLRRAIKQSLTISRKVGAQL